MKLLKSAILIAIIICSPLTLLSPAASRGQSVANQQCGAPVGGLQMCISTRHSSSAEAPELQVALHNVGQQDITLNLGIMLANGRVQLPSRIILHLTNANGRTRELHFFDRRYPAVAGRVDTYAVPLRVGSTYVLTLNLDQFWSPEANDLQSRWPLGRYQLVAHFEGDGAEVSNIERPGMRLRNFWRGELQSNVLMVER